MRHCNYFEIINFKHTYQMLFVFLNDFVNTIIYNVINIVKAIAQPIITYVGKLSVNYPL